MRDAVVAKTHSQVFEKVVFFKDKTKDFVNMVVHELKPVFLKNDDILYQSGEDIDQMYFMSIGKIKIYADLHDFIFDPYMLSKIKDIDDNKISN